MIAGILAWLSANAGMLAWQYGAPILIAILRRIGAINLAETLAAKALVWTKQNIKTYPAPMLTPGQQATSELAPGTTNTNLTVGLAPPRGPDM